MAIKIVGHTYVDSLTERAFHTSGSVDSQAIKSVESLEFSLRRYRQTVNIRVRDSQKRA